MKFREDHAARRNRSPLDKDPVAARRCFWIFVAIFSVTVFGASAQIASGYWSYCETVRRVSLPLGYSSPTPHVAGASEPIASAPVEEGLPSEGSRPVRSVLGR